MEAGLLGYYGMSLNREYNLKVIDVNKLIDEYNNNVHKLKIEDQFEYQREMFDRINKVLDE